MLKVNEIQVNSFLPPAIMELKGKYFIIAGTFRKEISKDWNRNKKIKWIPLVPDIKKTNRKDWKVKSDTNKKNIYTITLITYADGRETWNCDCMGFKFNYKCKHVTKKKSEIIK